MESKKNIHSLERWKDGIAIIGMACRFPGANDYNQFWQNLEQGVDSVTEIPAERWQLNNFYSPLLQQPNKSISKWGGFVQEVDQFDASFFGISPREAIRIDPQQRLMLELSWLCLEDAGYSPPELSGSSIGVFIGACSYDSILTLNEGEIDVHSGTGSWTTMIPNRISAYFNFSGPSLSVDTACSSSLVAIHQAINALKEEECDQALVGGISVLLSPTTYIQMSQQNMLSPTGKCRTFDSGADGYVRGEGAGVILLKPLEKAIQDQDHIHGVIKGSAVNHGGKARTLTSPNIYAQAKVIRAAHQKAGIAPNTISYIETHGTGTPLGDPIEINGLKRAFRQKEAEGEYEPTQSKHSYCGLGTVKTNIGHLEGAAGIAGVIKVLLAMKHRKLPKLLNFEQLNPHIKLEGSPFYIVLENQNWEQIKTQKGEIIPRRSGVSAFGIGGTNAHMVLEEAPIQFKVQKSKIKNENCIERPLQLLTLSAKTETALQELVSKYHKYLTTDTQTQLTDICYTANTGRAQFNHRVAVIASDKQELAEKLHQYQNKQQLTGVTSGQIKSSASPTKIAFLFTGQGSQYVNMGRQLYQTQAVFRAAIDQCQQILSNQLEYPLQEILYPSTDQAQSSSLINQTAYTQVALFALEYALAQLWQSWGIKPDVVVGHSVGEYVAATIAGIISLEDGLKLIAARGSLMQKLSADGEMVAVMASAQQVQPLLLEHQNTVSIAAINAPQSIVISGEKTAIAKVCQQLESLGIKTKRLQVSHGFHSPLMKPMLAEFEVIATSITYHQPQIPVISNLTGEIADERITTAQYWLDHVLAPVMFAQSMQTLSTFGCEVFLEVGPQPHLLSMGRQCLPQQQAVWLASMRAGVCEWHVMLICLAQLYVLGVAIDWSGFERDYLRQKVVLPTYPFQRQRYWIEIKNRRSKEQCLLRGIVLHPLLGQKLYLAGLDKQYRFESFIAEDEPAYLSHHRVFDKAVFPTTAYLEMALAAGLDRLGTSDLVVEDLVIGRGLILPTGEIKTVQTILTLIEKDSYQFQIFTQQQQENQDEVPWILHAEGKIRPDKTNKTFATEDLEKYKVECTQPVEVKRHYQQSRQRGIDYGVSFQGIEQLWSGANQALGKIKLPSELVGEASDYQLHPALLDAALQVINHALPEIDSNQTYLPVRIDQFKVYCPPKLNLWAIASVTTSQVKNRDSLTTQVTLVNDEGEIVATITGLQVKRATPQTLLQTESESITNWLYEVEWKAKTRFGRLLPPDYLLSPVEVEQKLSHSSTELVASADLNSYKEIATQLEELSAEYVIQAFLQLGWQFPLGAVFSTDFAVTSLGIVPSHKRLCHRMLQILAEVGILQADQQQWQVLETLKAVNPESKTQTLLSQHPNAITELTLLHRCASQLQRVLQGAIDPVQLVFPEGDLTTATQLYQESPVAKVMNTLVQKVITQASENLPQHRGIRLLEIGAGTGGTTSYILPHLNPSQTEYVFTDIGVLFTTKAQEKFSDYPFVSYQALDIEADPATQGFKSHQYDVIIAANVLHATANLTQTMNHVRQLLAPGGLLLLVEGTVRQRWLDLIFGLLEGWWKFSDWELRPDYPLLSRTKWQQLLNQTGFRQVVALPKLDKMGEALSQQTVILAQADANQADFSLSWDTNWLILADEQGIAQTLATQLRSVGAVCTLIFVGKEYQQLSPTEFTLNPEHPEEFQQLIAQITTHSPNLYGVVQCWTLETGISQTITGEELQSLTKLGCGTTLSLVQALVKGKLSQPPRLWLVTQGAQPVPDSIPVISGVAQSSLWGMGKVIDLEHPELKCVRIDLDPNQTVEKKGLALWSEIWSEDKEDQVALREDWRYVARLVSSRLRQQTLDQQQQMPTQPFRLTVTQRGTLDNLILQPTTRYSPRPDEVEIQVRATGLNFLDVVAALGLIPKEVDGVSQQHLLEMDSFGRECAGEIVAVGERVTGLKVGDSVIAMADGSFSQYVIVNAQFVTLKPDNLSFEEAASIPVNFLTAYYALHHVAQISAGDRILIHAAAGGTGMAAVQIAKLAGAEVFATASPPKWEALRKMGVKHIMNSRNVDFAEQVMEITHDEGVNVVFNSLTSGDFITKSLSVVSPQGRFVEIGKRGVWDSSQVAQVRPDVSYWVVDLVRESQKQPELIQLMLQELLSKFSSGLLQPPLLKIFAIADAISAFRYMQQAKHIGKIVVTQTAQPTHTITSTPLKFREDGTYLITGGLGGLGLLVARWMVEQGAKHLVLVSRRPPDDAAASKLAQLRAAGTQVIVAQADVSEYTEITRVLNDIKQSTPPLAGIIHSVGVLSDGVLQNQSWSSFEQVMAPKVQGAWYLHQLTKNQPLDFFVMFSSAASLLGSPGQGNHSAANAFLDGLAHYRKAMGLSGLSIHWGAVAEIGEAAERGADIRAQQSGMGAIAPDQVIKALELILSNTATEVGVVPIDWSAWQDKVVKWPFLAEWENATSTTVTQNEQLLEKLKRIQGNERENILITYLQNEIAQVLGMKTAEIDAKQPLNLMGIDSLMAVELRNRIKTKLEADVPITKFIEGDSIVNLSADISQQLSQSEQTLSETSLPTLVTKPDQRYQPFPLNEIQQAYWLGRQQIFDLGNIATHIYIEVDCENLDLERLNQAWQKLIVHHDMLRMVVAADAQQQVLQQVPTYEIKVLDLTVEPLQTITSKLEIIREQMSHEILPANQWPLFNIKATRLNQRIRLHISLDLLIADAWSIYLIFTQWMQLYKAPESSLPTLELSFRDYVLGELALKDTPQYQRCQKYWFDRLDSLPPAPEIPLSQPISAITQPRFQRRSAKLSQTHWQQLQQKARQANLTPSGLLLTAFADILNLWSKSPKFTINLTLFNRLPIHPQVNQLVGDFTSLILLEVDNSAATSFINRAQKLQKQLWQDLEHNYVSAVEVQRELRRRGRSQPMGVVFTSTLGLGSLASEDLGEGFGLKQLGEMVYSVAQTPQVWLDHQVLEEKGALVLNWDAVADLFPEDLLDQMFAAYCNWLKQLATSDESWSKTHYQLLLPEQLALQTQINQTTSSLSEETLHSLFIKQVKAQSESPAIITTNKILSYQELYRRSHYLGYELRRSGIQPNTLVAVVMEKGWEQVVAVLGILMSGGAYLPIDPGLPQERRWYLLAQAEVKQVLTQSHLQESLCWPEGIACWSVDTQEIAPIDLPILEPVQTPEDLAYVIYTSGSTGLPKGVMIDHRGAVNTILDINQRFQVKPSDRILALSALNFDLSVYDIFGILAAGGTIVMPAPTGTKDPGHWIELITTHQVTIWNSVPALMQMLVEYLLGKSQQPTNDLRVALLSGDWLPINLPEKIQSIWSNAQVISLGGATEASIWSISYAIDQVNSNWKSIPYGKPLINQRFYVLNELMEVRPIWVPGQLYIGGVGLAQGYWKNEQKTQASFITHPLTQERLYKTGDLGRYLPDGNIEFLGREDFQVKINGYRVELGEIEAALQQISGIQEAVVSAVGDSQQNKRLVGYILLNSPLLAEACQQNEVISQDSNSITKHLRQHLKEKLPEYMVPADYIVMEAWPLTANGKVDRQRLPKPEENTRSNLEYVAPKTETEQKIAAILQEVLSIKTVGIHDNFYDIGGNSLLLIRVQNKLQEIFDIELKVVDLFTYPTVYSLSQYIAGNGDNSAEIGKNIATNRLQKRTVVKEKGNIRKTLRNQK
ncbi:beta-ketoacyl synthase [Nostoc sp. NIES-4103]|nr:beta-ketoacyl synthase [Nostoc sp. NIES-4103]